MAEVLTSLDLPGTELQLVPLSSLLEWLVDDDKFKINSTFSLWPYLEELNATMKSACSDSREALIPIMESYARFADENAHKLDLLRSNKEFNTIARVMLPSLFIKGNMSFLAPPFSPDIIMMTEKLENRFSTGVWQLVISSEQIKETKSWLLIEYRTYILNKFYKQHLEECKGDIITLRDKGSGLQRHYKLEIQNDFVDAKIKGKLPELSKAEIEQLISEISDSEFWNKLLPAELFEFKGFVIGNWLDVSQIEAVARLDHYISNVSIEEEEEPFTTPISIAVSSYINKPNIDVGLISFEYNNLAERYSSLTLMAHEDIFKEIKGALGNTFLKRCYSEQTALISCIGDFEDDLYQKELFSKGYKDVILYPIVREGKIKCILEIASKEIHALNSTYISGLSPITDRIEEGFDRMDKMIKNRVASIIQEQFTSIHPSVEWKFNEVATNYFHQKVVGERATLAPVVFKELNPLYGQADIVSSSTIRNNAIQHDLIYNLELVDELLTEWYNRKKLHVLDQYRIKVQETTSRIESNFNSRDESAIVAFLTNEVHPLLKKLSERYEGLPRKSYKKYLAALDPKLNIIYQQRKAFEESVMQLNNSISEYLEVQNHQLQKVLPHYFEKYKTDGVEYNIYLGQSLLKENKFSDFDLSEFRIWQLVTMCEVVRMVKGLQPNLATPLTTAQLIFVYNSKIGIRFRMDEKRFDVDGSYNVRYEILKKRIDKAVIKGTKDRLTVEDKIAIVYLNEEDKREYLGYLEYLIEKQYILENIEDLYLEGMQGASGLKALRVTVNYQ